MSDPGTSPPAPGTRLGKFELLRSLGAGGMGQVYAARDTLTGAEVAVKVLHAETLSRDPAHVDRFKRETRICQGLSHPNLIRIHDLGEDGGIYFLSMELLEGHDLRAELDRHPRPTPQRIERLLGAILDGLGCAHRAGVIHRDLKPQNVFLARDPDAPDGFTPKLLDFGLARSVDRTCHTVDGDLLGTPAYMSPEQARGDRHIDGRADLYSVGIVLYEMLSGAVPFEADSPIQVAVAQLQSAPPDLGRIRPDVHPGLARLAMRLLEKDPDARFADAAEARAALGDAVRDDGAGRDAPTRVLPDRPTARGRSRAGLALVAATLLLGVLAWTRGPGGTGAQPRGREPLAGASGNASPSPVWASVIAGDLAADRGDLDASMEHYRRGAAAREGTTRQRALAHCRQARVSLRRGDVTAAEAQIARAEGIAPDLPEVHRLRARAAEMRGRDDEAELHLEAALAAAPHEETTRLLLDELRRRRADAADPEIARAVAERIAALEQRAAGSAAAPEGARPRSLWVTPIEVRGGLEPTVGYGAALEGALARELMTRAELRVVNRAMVADLLRELDLASSALADPEAALRLGRVTGARFVVRPAIEIFGGRVLVVAEVVEVETTEVVALWSREVADGETLETVAKAVGDEVARVLTAHDGTEAG